MRTRTTKGPQEPVHYYPNLMEATMKQLLGSALALVFTLAFVGLGWAGAAPALEFDDGSSAAAHNKEGIMHYDLGHWGVASEHFLEAVNANPDAAEAHYNYALTLDKMGQHMDAAKHFKHAQERGGDNPAIQNSRILQAHLKMLH